MPKFITIGYGDRAGYERTQPGKQGRLHDDWRIHGVAPSRGRLAVIEAADMNEAIRIVSLTPCAVAHGVVEIWPLEQASEP